MYLSLTYDTRWTYSIRPTLVDILESLTETNAEAKKPKCHLRNRDRDVVGKREIKDVLEKEKGALGSENIKYLGTKFECYKIKVIYFETSGVYYSQFSEI